MHNLVPLYTLSITLFLAFPLRTANQQNCVRTVLDLLRMGCDQGCVMRNDNDCPECDMTCNSKSAATHSCLDPTHTLVVIVMSLIKFLAHELITAQ